MAVNPSARLRTLTFQKGTVTAPAGLITHLFGNSSGQVSWTASANPPDPVTGRRRRKYGTRQRSSSRAGEVMAIALSNGEQYSVRITGTHTNFIDFFLSQGAGDKVVNVFSERGTIYGPQAKQVETV
jgi:hypothetical protein